MRQIEVTAPIKRREDITQLAYEANISQVGTSEVSIHQKGGKVEKKVQLKIETDNETAKRFITKLTSADYFNRKDFSVVADDVGSIISSEKIEKVTQPMRLPSYDVNEELWIRNHITPSYIARALVSGLILSYGMIQGNILTIAAALLFTPFLPAVLAISYGLLKKQNSLVFQGAQALTTSAVLVFIAGVIVASITDQPMQYNQFDPLIVNFLISLVVGVVAGLATADQAGMRELLAITAAAQFAIYPAWYGIAIIKGLPKASIISERFTAFGVNIITILAASAVIYWILYQQQREKAYN